MVRRASNITVLFGQIKNFTCLTVRILFVICDSFMLADLRMFHLQVPSQHRSKTLSPWLALLTDKCFLCVLGGDVLWPKREVPCAVLLLSRNMVVILNATQSSMYASLSQVLFLGLKSEHNCRQETGRSLWQQQLSMAAHVCRDIPLDRFPPISSLIRFVTVNKIRSVIKYLQFILD